MVSALGIVGAGATISIVINAVDKFTNVFKNVNAGLLATGVAITAVGIAGGKLVSGLVQVAGQFEQTQIAFTTMLGSAEEADKLLRELADFAAKTPFEIVGIEQNAKMLLAMSIEVDNLLPTLKTLGDISAGLNVPLERLALNFGQVRVQGKLTGRELRDFSVAGVPLIAELAKNLNKTEAEIKDMVSAGKIGFNEVNDAFISMTSEGGKFFDLMDAQSKTFLGQISNINDSFTKVKRTMGEVFLPVAKKVAGALAKIVEWMERHPTITKWAAAILGIATALALIIGPFLILLALLPAMAIGWGMVSAAMAPILLPILAIIVAIGLIIAAAILLYKHWAPIKIFFAKLWNSIVGYFETGVNGVIRALNWLIRGYNKVAGILGFGGIGEIGKISFTGALIDIDAIGKTLEVQKEITKEVEKQSKFSKIINIQQKSFASSSFQSLQDYENFIKAQKLIALGQPEHLKFIPTIRDVEGKIININIENVNGLDAENVSKALSDELFAKVSL